MKSSKRRDFHGLPLEAKYWGRIEEREKGQGDYSRNDKKAKPDSSKSMEFDEQCLKYMNILGKQYGVLTESNYGVFYLKEFFRLV